ncbi:MAG: adenosylmethionine decarboxylase [Nitrospirota bacterium]
MNFFLTTSIILLYLFKPERAVILILKGGRELYALGTHLLVELRDCNPEILKSIEKVRNILVSAAKEAKATVIDTSFHEFNPFGISGMIVIAESHISIHTWPEYGYAAADIFTCGDIIKPEVAVSYLIKQFRSKNPSVVEIKRGILSHKNEKLPHKVSAAELQMVS